ncbi:MAG: DnaJ C-terminal domain-containing protein [Thauera sp.]|jgi:molecular chaperone DnaJ
MPDAHALLGLQPGATPQQVKRAFRKLAMQWHPDRNADPAAAAHFLRLREAHDGLLSALLDEAESASERGRGAAGPEPESAPQTNHAPPERGADRMQTLKISIEESFTGALCAIVVPRLAPCAQCGGSGNEKLSVSQLCPSCRGTGRLRAPDGLVRCADCDGRGYRTTCPCSGCGGSGEQTVERRLEVRIPAGVVDDDELRLAGEGDPHPEPGHLPGDLRLRILLAPHPLFRRDGRDLVLQRPVSALRLLIGGTIRVPHPAGLRSLRIEPGLAHPRSLRIAGAGFPARARRPAGDLVVEFEPILPQSPDTALHDLIDQLDRALVARADHHFPELARWESDWLGER